MSEIKSSLAAPLCEVHADGKTPHMVNNLGELGLARIVSITPAPDRQDSKLFLLAEIANGTSVRYGPKFGDDAFILEVHAKGQDVEAIAKLEQTIKDIETIANMWHRPEEYLALRSHAMATIQS